MPGDFDSLLKWPLKAVMKFELHQQSKYENHGILGMELNQKKRVEHKGMTIGCGSTMLYYPFSSKHSLHIRIVGVQF